MSSQGPTDRYLATLRKALGNLPAPEIDDILREIRGHIAERAEAGGQTDGPAVEQILRALGRPEEIGSLYRTDAMVSRARAAFSPVLIIFTTFGWAKRTAIGFVALFLGAVGYLFGLQLMACGVLKPFFPDHIGLWIHAHGVSLATPDSRAMGPELLGWWLIPVAVLGGGLILFGTTAFLRWMLRFASRPLAARLSTT